MPATPIAKGEAFTVELRYQGTLRKVIDPDGLAGRGQDRLDLENLERVHGELPIDPIPDLDS